jgi:hypothetical protein
MREALVAWAGDCRLRGEVELEEGRLSDQVNDRELLTFFGATLEALEDGHEVAVDELEVERWELHLIEVEGRQGDPERRLRTIPDPVRLEVGPFVVTGNLHRPPNSPTLAALQRRQWFVPLTEARIDLADGTRPSIERPVILVNKERIGKFQAFEDMQGAVFEPPTAPQGDAAAGGSAG